MQKQECPFMHSKIVSILYEEYGRILNEEYGNDYQNGVLDATTSLLAFLELLQPTQRWCRDVNYFYGNLICWV
jgi:hypothetical protein